jgi:hypothetical protein
LFKAAVPTGSWLGGLRIKNPKTPNERAGEATLQPVHRFSKDAPDHSFDAAAHRYQNEVLNFL